MTRKHKSGASRRKVSQNKSSTSSRGPADSALRYNGPVQSRDEWNGNDKFMFPLQFAQGVSGNTTTPTSFVFYNDLVSVVATITDLPAIFSAFGQYRILAIQVQYQPVQRYTQPGVTPQNGAGYGVVWRGIPPSPDLVDYTNHASVRMLGFDDPWTSGRDYKGSSFRPLLWKATGPQDMLWKDINPDKSSDIESNYGAGIGIYVPVQPNVTVFGQFLVQYKIQLKNACNDGQGTPTLHIEKAPGGGMHVLACKTVVSGLAPKSPYFKR